MSLAVETPASNAAAATPDARRRERLILKAMSSAVLCRPLTMALTLVQMPIALSALGKEGFGCWIALTAAVSTIAFLDFGVALGMQNRVSHYYGRDDMLGVKRVFVLATAVLAVVAAVSFGVGLPIIYAINWGPVFKVVDPRLASSIAPAVVAAMVFFCANLFVSAIHRLAVGIQLTWMSTVAQLGASAGTVAACWFAAHYANSLAAFVYSITVPTVLAAAVLGCALLPRFPRGWRFTQGDARADLRSVLHEGILFLPPQIGATLISSAPAVIVSTTLGGGASALFGVVLRLFGIVLQTCALLVNPLWPAYAEASVRGDFAWIRRTFFRSMILMTTLTVLASLVVVVLARPIILIWLRDPALVPPLSLALLMAAWTVLMCLGHTVAVLLNGLGALRIQATFGLASAITAVAVMPMLLRNLGVIGAPLALATSYALLAAVPVALQAAGILRDLRRKTLAQNDPGHDAAALRA